MNPPQINAHHELSAEGASHTSLGRSPRYTNQASNRAESPTHRLSTKPLLFAIAWSVLITGCKKPTEVQTIRFANSPVFYRVENYVGKGAIAPSATAVFAVIQNKSGSSEKLVLSGTYLGLKSVVWQAENQGYICLAGGYTETYRRIVALTIKNETTGVYTHISDQC